MDSPPLPHHQHHFADFSPGWGLRPPDTLAGVSKVAVVMSKSLKHLFNPTREVGGGGNQTLYCQLARVIGVGPFLKYKGLNKRA